MNPHVICENTYFVWIYERGLTFTKLSKLNASHAISVLAHDPNTLIDLRPSTSYNPARFHLLVGIPITITNS